MRKQLCSTHACCDCFPSTLHKVLTHLHARYKVSSALASDFMPADASGQFNYSNAAGVNINTQVPPCIPASPHHPSSLIVPQVDFGGVSAIRSVDPSLPKQLDYFGSSVNALVAAGLVVNSTVLGAPYDWRLEPSGANHCVLPPQLS